MSKRLVIGLIAVLFFAGCGSDDSRNVDSSEEAKLAKEYLALFSERNYSAIEELLEPSIRRNDLRPILEEIAGFFPPDVTPDVELVGFRIRTGMNQWSGSYSFEFEYPNRWLVATVSLQKLDGVIVVTHVDVQEHNDSLMNINRFTLVGKGFIHYLVITYAAMLPIFILGVLMVCIRTPMAKRKWLWCVFILIGFSQMTFVWTDGSLHFNPLGFQLLGSGFVKPGPYAPVFIQFSLPIGGLLFLFRRKQLQNSVPTDFAS